MFADLYRNVKAVKEEHLSFAFHVSFIRHSEPLTFVTVTAANIWDSSIPSTFKFQIPADASVAVFLETTGHDREGLWSTGRPLAMNSGWDLFQIPVPYFFPLLIMLEDKGVRKQLKRLNCFVLLYAQTRIESQH